MSLYDRADVPGYAIEYPNNCRCGPCTAVREYRERRESADLPTYCQTILVEGSVCGGKLDTNGDCQYGHRLQD